MSGDFPSWQEWSELSQDQRDYSLYKILAEINQQRGVCDQKFDMLLKRRWKDTVTAGVTGAATALGITLSK